MKAAVVTSDRQFTLTELSPPLIPSGGALIRVTGCGLCGSDVDKLLYRPDTDGHVLGHEVSGVLETLSPEAQVQFPAFRIGQRVALAHHVPCQTCHYCRSGSPSKCPQFLATNITPGGFAQWIAVGENHLAHTVFPLPPDITDAEGSCIEPLACCLRAIDRMPAQYGPDVLVIGLGFVGLLAGQALMARGYRPYGVDRNPNRVRFALRHQMCLHADVPSAEAMAFWREQTHGRGVDSVFLTVVTPETIRLAMAAVRDGGMLMLFTSYPSDEALLNQNDLYFREISVIPSYSPGLSQVAAAHRMILSGQVQVKPLYTHTFSLSDLNDALEAYRSGDAIKVFITP